MIPTVPVLLLSINLAAFAADSAPQNGANDLENALDRYLALVEMRPDDLRALEMAAGLAREVGKLELAADLMIQRVEVAVSQRNKTSMTNAHDDLSALWEREPEWVQEKLRDAAAVDESQVEDATLWRELTAEAKAALKQGDFEKAVVAEEGAVFLGEETLGPNHWMTLVAKRDLGFIHRRIGNSNEAESWLSKSAAGAEQVLGEVHPRTLEIKELLAELYDASGYPQEAEMMRTVVVAGYEESLGTAHPETIDARHNLIEQLETNGAYRQALEDSKVFCAEIEQYYGAWHPQSLECQKRLASLYTDKGDLDEAEVTYQELVDRMSEVLPAVNEDVLNALSQIAEIYRRQGRYVEAGDLLSGIIHTALQAGEVDLSYRAKSYLVRVLNDQGEYGAARKLLEEVVGYGE